MKLNYLWIVYLFLLVLTPFVSAEIVDDVNYATSVDVVKGVNVTGTVESTRVYNSGYWRIEEESGTPGLLFTANVSGVQGNVTNLHVNARYEGGASHDVALEIYDCSTDSWFLLYDYLNSPNFEYNTFDISFVDCVDHNNNILLRFNHVDSGVTSHHFDIDYLVVESEYEFVPDTFSFFELDFNDTLIIILMSIFVLSGIVLCFMRHLFIGGIIITLSGLFLLFTPLYLVIGFLLVLFGFLAMFSDE